ncbi:hypothetical protein I8G32_04700 [Rhodopseudomonas palustris]|uniref:Uncharacterized protein n=2 Tax=Rhodopseudomonas palustris TaxID=1076 RepID=Q6N165_RHOPA|nr:hypothetical protein [Rhodopseudomonas palustris]QQM06120.1 hypothetical protein I8G32_04700 [Rhodopseudomonas palustris]WAB77439.1 hypothetical protein OR798_23625 [Rhodopseudomonas palustris]WCL94750.1 hypothetical protein TX73_023620 [Rhodopseudomonas palustris CGA009]CAE29984.1 conserved unknown protein [Rhodopseudomonas palustris CGA009]
MKKGRPTQGRSSWRQSAEFREIGRAAIRQWNARRDAIERCGANRKHGMGPCRQWPMANGRCYLHGGSTPRGDRWHTLQFPDCSTPEGEAKAGRKLRDHQRFAKQRAARIAEMTPDERAAHRKWHRARKPGSAGARKADGAQARQDAEARRLLAAEPPERPADAELERARAALAVAEANLARLTGNPAVVAGDEGVFG